MDTLNLFKNETDFVEFNEGDTVFKEGDPADYMYVVKEGEVEIIAGGKTVDSASLGEIFGEMALIDSSARSATARATSHCVLIPVDQKRFTFLVQKTPFFSIYVMRVLANRIRSINRMVSD